MQSDTQEQEHERPTSATQLYNGCIKVDLIFSSSSASSSMSRQQRIQHVSYGVLYPVES